MAQRVLLFTFFALLVITSGLLFVYYRSVDKYKTLNKQDGYQVLNNQPSVAECGIFIESKSEDLKLSIENKQVWDKYARVLLACEDDYISIVSPKGGVPVQVRQVRIVLTDEVYRGTKTWNNVAFKLYFDYAFSGNDEILSYYISPFDYLPSDIKGDLPSRVGMFINFILVSLTEHGQDEKSNMMKQWDTSGKTLTDMGLKLETI